jgi:hypothetical protein
MADEEYGENKNHVEYVTILRKQMKIARDQKKYQEALDISTRIEGMLREIYGENLYAENK